MCLRRAAALFGAVVLLSAAGCSSGNIVRVTGQVVENGQPYALQSGECIQIDLVTTPDSGAKVPLSLMTYSKKDGSFAADQNDGSGRGLPPGKYAVRLNRETTTLGKKAHPKLFKDAYTFELAAGKPVHLTIDLASGAIQQ
jgi:hypothetical protein